MEQLQKLLQNEPDDTFLNFGLAMEMARQGQTEAAMRQFDRVIELDAQYCAAYFHKGKTLIAAGRESEGADELRRGIEVAGTCGDLHARGEMTELLESLA